MLQHGLNDYYFIMGEQIVCGDTPVSAMVHGRKYPVTVDGVTPLNLPNSVGENLVSWSITGSIYQEWTPSPESTMTDNLLNNYSIELGGGTSRLSVSDEEISFAALSANTYVNSGKIIGSGTTYALSYDTNAYVSVSLKCYSSDDTYLGDCNTLSEGENEGRKYYVFTTLANTSYLRVVITATVSGNITMSKPMLNFGGQVKNFVAYGAIPKTGPCDVKMVGDYDVDTGTYKIPVVTSGRNMFDKSAVRTGWYTATTKSILLTDVMGRFVTVAVKPNTTYCLTRKYFALTAERNSVILTSEYPIHGTVYNTIVSRAYTEETVVFTTGNSDRYASIMFARGANDEEVTQFAENIQLVEGSEPLPYEPYHEPITTNLYLPTPLAKDEVLRSDGSREVKWGKYICTGDETWSMIDQGPSGSQYFYIANINFTGKPWMPNGAVYCNYAINRIAVGVTMGNSYGFLCWFAKDIVDTMAISKWTEWVKSKYDSGNPLTFIYKIATPTTEQVTNLPAIPTIKGTTVIDVDTEIKPESMTVKYISSKRR